MTFEDFKKRKQAETQNQTQPVAEEAPALPKLTKEQIDKRTAELGAIKNKLFEGTMQNSGIILPEFKPSANMNHFPVTRERFDNLANNPQSNLYKDIHEYDSFFTAPDDMVPAKYRIPTLKKQAEKGAELEENDAVAANVLYNRYINNPTQQNAMNLTVQQEKAARNAELYSNAAKQYIIEAKPRTHEAIEMYATAYTEEDANVRLAEIEKALAAIDEERMQIGDGVNIGNVNDLSAAEYNAGMRRNAAKMEELDNRAQALANERDAIKKAMELKDEKRKDSGWGQFAANYQIGQLGEEINQAWNRYADDPTDANYEYALQLEAIQAMYERNNRYVLDKNYGKGWLTEDLARNLPQQVNQAKRGLLAAAITLPALIATGGASMGLTKYAYTAGVGSYSQDAIRGGSYRAMIMSGASEEDARKASADEAVLSSFVEMADTALELATFGWNGKLAEKIASPILKWAGDNAARHFAIAAAKFGLNITQEGVEEGIQEIISKSAIDRALSGDVDGNIGDLAKASLGKAKEIYTGGDATAKDRQDIAEAAKAGRRLGFIMGGGRIAADKGVRSVSEYVAQARQNKFNARIVTQALGQVADGPKSIAMAEQIVNDIKRGKEVSDETWQEFENIAEEEAQQAQAETQQTAETNLVQPVMETNPEAEANPIVQEQPLTQQQDPVPVQDMLPTQEQMQEAQQTTEQRTVPQAPMRNDVIEAMNETMDNQQQPVEQQMPDTDAVAQAFEDTMEQRSERVDRFGNELPQGTGAMEYNPDSYSAHQLNTPASGFFPEGPNSVRPLDTPRVDPQGRAVGRAINNAKGSPIMPNRAVPGNEQRELTGVFSHDVNTDRGSLARAQRALNNGQSLETNIGEIRNQLQHRASKDVVTKAFEAVRLAYLENTEEMDANAADLLVDITQAATNAGQILQAMAMLRRLTPEGRLMSAQRLANRMANDANRNNTLSYADREAIIGQLQDQYNTALSLIQNIHEAFNQSRNHGAPVDTWIQRIAEQLANTVDGEARPQRRLTVAQQIRSDLLRFARDYLPRNNRANRRTYTDILRDFIGNRDAYVEAWNSANDILRERYGNEEDYMDFILSTMPLNNGHRSSDVVLRAVIEAATEEQLTSSKDIAIRDYLGDRNAMVNQIANPLIASVGATGEDAALIRNTVSHYLNERANRYNQNNNAEATVDSNIRGLLRDMGSSISQIIRSTDQTKANVADQIADILVNQYGISAAASAVAANTIVEQFSRQVAEQSEAALERMFADRPKKETKTLARRFEELANMGAFSGSQWQAQATEKLFGHQVTINPDLITEFRNATTDEAREEIMQRIYENIGEQIPSTFIERWNNWRYLSMLFSIRTNLRNFAGNVAFSPSRVIGNQLSGLLQKLFIKNEADRTRSFGFLTSEEGKALKNAAFEHYEKVAKNALENGDKWQSGESSILRSKKIFRSNKLEAVRKLSMNMLEKGDRPFVRSAYVNSLASYLNAKGFTAKDFTGNGMTEQQKQDAVSFAMEDARKATFKDLNHLSRLGRAISKVPVLNAAVPFGKVTGNILARSIEYSPVGLLKTIVADIPRVAKGNISANQFIDNLSNAIGGSVLNVGLGALLSSPNGFQIGPFTIRLVAEPEDKEQDELEGRKRYAVEINGKTYAIDWLAPAAIPLFMGVEWANYFRKEAKDDDPAFKQICDSFFGIVAPMGELSMLDGLTSAFDSMAYADGTVAKVGTFASTLTLNYLLHGVPTVFSQFEKAFSPNEKNRQTTFIDKDHALFGSGGQRTIANLHNKIPFFDYQQVDYIDAWGRTQDNGNMFRRGFNSIVNPVASSDIVVTEVDEEIRKLEKEVPDANITPSRVKDNMLSVNGEKIFMTEDEFVTYATAKGQTDLDMRSIMMDTEEYQIASPEAKIKAHNKSEEYAKIIAMEEAGLKPKRPDWMIALEGADEQTIANTLIAKAVESEAKAIADDKQYAGYEIMIDNGQINDVTAELLMPSSLQTAYNEGGKGIVSPVEVLDAYSYINADGSDTPTDEKLDSLNGYLQTTYANEPEKMTAMYKVIYDVYPYIITTDRKVPASSLVYGGKDGEMLFTHQLTSTQKVGWFGYKAKGGDMVTFSEFLEYANDANSDSYSTRKEKIVAWLNANIPDQRQRDALYYTIYKK